MGKGIIDQIASFTNPKKAEPAIGGPLIGGVDYGELKSQRVQLYNTITVDLATARTDAEMVFTGNYIYGLEATDGATNVDIRINEKFRPVVNIRKGRGVRAPFYRFYLTNAAQAGKTLTIIIGIEAGQFEVIDNLTAITVSGIIETYEQNLANGWATAGIITSPAANTVMADTGQLAAGIYDFRWAQTGGGVPALYMTIEHRNAANTATLFSQMLLAGEILLHQFFDGYSMALNERLRVIMRIAGAATYYQASIWWARRQ